ncbi:MAG: motility protein A [Mycobacterium leprae]
MDLATIGGFLIAVIMIVLGARLEEVTFTSIVLAGRSAFLIVIGGSIGATIFSHTMGELKKLPAALKKAFIAPKFDYAGTIDYLVGLSERARRNGLLSLQDEAEQATDPIIKRGLTMAVDGANPDAVQEALEAMCDMADEELAQAAAVLETCGGYSPTIGILGTVMALVTVMNNLSTPDVLGGKIATAFLATLYGVGFANLLFLPLGAKIRAVIKQQSKFNEMVTEAITGLQSGESPRRLREKLAVYMGPGAVPKGEKATAGRSQAQEGD